MDTDDDRVGWPVVPGYELHEVLGRGGFATVYRATQTSVDRPVALKVLAAAALDPTTERRFRHEVRAVGALSDHPHVVALIDAGTTTTGAPFISMQLVPAGSLGDRIRAFGPLPPAEVARVGAEVADALEAAHEAGILHRDIKPDNVLVGRRGRALLTDFGIATLDDGTMTATGAITGTLAYTAPEIIKGQRPSPATDVFALGATLYALVAGRAAFATGEDHVAAVMWRVTNEEPAPLPPEVPFALVDLIGACMAKDPAERPALPAVATALEAIAADRAEPPVAVAEPDDDATVALAPSPAVDDPTVVAAPDEPDATVVAQPSPAADEATVVAGPAADEGSIWDVPAGTGAPVVAPAAPPPRRPTGPGFPTRKLVVVAVLIAVSMLAAVALALTLGGGDDGGGGEPRTIAVGGAPVAVVVGPDGGAWVANRDDATVTHVDADGDGPATVDVGGSPSALVATDDAVWVANAEDATLDRLDPDGDASTSTPNVGDRPTALAATAGSVWVVNQDDGDIARIDTSIDEYADDVPLDLPGTSFVAATDDAVWVAIAGDDGTNKVLRIGADSVEIEAAIDLDGAPTGITATGGAVWVALGDTGTVARIDPDAGAVAATVEIGDEVGAITADGDDVWVADVADDRIVQVDTEADEAGTAVATGARPDAVAVADGVAWVVTTDAASLRRIAL